MSGFPIAVIGAGAVGRSHIERVLRTPGFTLVGVAEPSPPAQRWCAERNVPVFASQEELLDRTRLAGAIVATPNATHVQVARDCLSRGVPVLLEKPVADTLEAALALVRVQESTGVPVLVGHHRRHNPVLQRARDLVSQGRLGKVLTACVLSTFCKPGAYFDVAWRRETGGGTVLINLIHDIDMLIFLLGPISAVQARTSNVTRGFEVEDTAAALLEFASGALATLVASDATASPWNWDLCAGEQAQYPRQPVQTHFVCGTHGSLSLPDLSLWQYRGERHWHRELTREQSVVHAMDPYERQLCHFAEVAMAGATPACSARDGARTLQAALAILSSAQAGRRVECESLVSPA